METNHSSKTLLISAALVVLLAVSYGGYRFRLTVLELRAVKSNLAATTAKFQQKVKTLEDENKVLMDTKVNLEGTLLQAQNDNTNLSGTLAAEQSKNNIFESQIQSIGSTVGTLEKLSKTDKELLRKYSKVFFLSENYVPSDLANIASTSLYKKNKPIKIHAKVLPYLERLFQAEEGNGTPLRVISAYRSFGDQAVLKSGYTVTYGSGANAFSADQGYSEHQLGTTLDFTTVALGAAFNEFDETKAYAWLNANAYKYGFVLSYPKNNEYYQFEPWHWRFVGVALATKLHNSKQFFYDLDQREIDSYLISIFD
jgi:LAS superfamily LD-carboxypeptidase LdcB